MAGMGKPDVITYALTFAATVMLAIAVVFEPRILVGVPAVAALVYGLSKPRFRMLFFVVGAFLVFQSGDGLSPSKLGYLAAVVFSTVWAVHNLGKHADRDYIARVKPALIGAGLLAFWVLGPMLVQNLMFNGVPPTMWARDALTYLLISAGVVIGVDAGREVSLKWARLSALGVGLLAAYGFAAEWIERRGLVESATTGATSQNPILGSITALMLPLSLCLVLGLAQRRIRMKWLIFVPLFLIAVLVTGTRTGVVLAVALVGVLGSTSKKRVPFGKALLGGAASAGILSVALPFAGSLFSSEHFVEERLNLLVRTIQEGVSSDHSGIIRLRATAYCLDILEKNPLMGQGLGIYFPNPNPGGVAANFTLDSWALLPAKFGILGTSVVAVAIVLIFRGLMWKGNGDWLYENTAVRGAFLAVLALIPFGPPTEDKGFAVMIALAATLVCAAAKQSSQPNEEIDEGPPSDLRIKPVISRSY